MAKQCVIRSISMDPIVLWGNKENWVFQWLRTCCAAYPVQVLLKSFKRKAVNLGKSKQDMQDTLLKPLCFNHNFFGCPQTCSYPLNTMAQIDMEERKNISPRVEYRSKWGHPEYMYILNALKGRWCSLVVTRCFDFATVTRCLQALFCQFDLTLEKKLQRAKDAWSLILPTLFAYCCSQHPHLHSYW